MAVRKSIIPVTRIDETILPIRGQKVMLDSDLATLYGVSTKALIQAMKRNADRFPEDFVFQLNRDEAEILRSQFVTSRSSHGGRRYPPYVFTEHGAIMLASVLNSQRAIEASIFVVRAFVKLREVLATHKEIAKKFADIEKQIAGHDKNIKVIFDTLWQLKQPSPIQKRQIGFERNDKK